MRIFILLLLLPVANSVVAQSDTSYQLLWYTGKKIRTNVLLRENGDTVRYNPVKRTVSITSSQGDGKKFDNMLAELGKTKQRLQETITQLNYLPKPVLPPLSLLIRDAYAEADREYRQLLSNVITIPNVVIPGITATGGKGSAYDAADIADAWDDLIKEFRDYLAYHKDDGLVNLPEPPRFDFTYCASCDSSKNNAYRQAMDEFKEALYNKDDLAILEKAWAATIPVNNMEWSPRKSEIQTEISRVIQFVGGRAKAKVTRMIEKHIDDPERALAVLEVATQTERQLQIIGLYGVFPAYASRAFTAYENRLLKAINEYDYPVVLNHKLLFFIDRQMQLYNYRLDATRRKVFQFNRFKMRMDIAAKATGDGGFALAALEGDNWFSAYVDGDACRLKWYLIESDKTIRVAMTLTDAQLEGNGGKVTYVGGKKWFGNTPTIKLDFCNDETEDSIIAYPFYVDGLKEYWSFPRSGTHNVSIASGVLLSCFLDADRTRQEGAEYKADPKKIEKLKQEMLAKYNKLGTIPKGNIGNSLEGIDMNELYKLANTTSISNDIGELVQKVNPGRYIFTPVLHNKDKVLVKERLDGKILFPENTATEYALFDMTIEHDPRQ